ncbi:MAG: HD domain-containing protein [bacterium]|nr:HD domain-containing protein [bacterium]
MINLRIWKPKTNLDKKGLRIAKLLQAKQFKAFWVGGVVRDILLNKQSDNIDIATDARPDEIERILEKAKIKYVTIGKKFGTIMAISDQHLVEITTFRAEGKYSNKRHPDSVQFIKDYEEDAKRRDFTINALYFDPISKQLFDPTNGINDLKNKILKFIGDPKKRIDEDALRLIRAVRLSTQLGFRLEKNAFAAIKTRAKFINQISAERVKNELDKILLAKSKFQGFQLLDKIGLLQFIIPETTALKTFYHKSKLYHLEGSIFDHTMLAVKNIKGPDLKLVYAAIFHDIGKPATAKKVLKDEGWVISTRGHADVSAEIFRNFAIKYHFSKKNRMNIEWAVKNHMLMMVFTGLDIEQQLDYALHSDFELLINLWRVDSLSTLRVNRKDNVSLAEAGAYKRGKALLKLLARKKIKVKKLLSAIEISKHTKIKSGPVFGKIKNELEKKIYLGKINRKKEAEKFLKSLDTF